MQSSPEHITVEDLAEEYLGRRRAGQRPTVAEYVQRYPELADEIRACFPALQLVEDCKPASESEVKQMTSRAREWHPQQLGDFRIIREVGRGGMGVVYEAEQLSLGRRVAIKVLPQQLLASEKQRKRFQREAKAAARLHHTNIVPVFGVGQQDGLHYYVMQLIDGLGLDEVIGELNRIHTAREVSRATTPPNEQQAGHSEDRSTPVIRHEVSAVDAAKGLLTGHFEQTVLVADEVDCQVEAGSDEGVGFSGQKSVPPRDRQAGVVPSEPRAQADTAGGRLSETLHGAGSFVLPGKGAETAHISSRQAYWQSVARVGVQAAEALQYAHDQGIIHRDVKPGNLLLDTRGTVWVTDFGLAKAADQPDLTHTGDVLGTLRYMAPEQFEGTTDARSDVYSLGLTLYELLALRPAFDESERHRLIQQVTGSTPQRLRLVDAHIPRDIETIVHKAIDRDPSHRYQTAQDLADDLQRYLGDEPIRAKWVSPFTRVRRWCKRSPMAAALVLLLMLLAIGGPLVAANQLRLRQAASAAALLLEDEQEKTKQALADSQQKSLELEIKHQELEREHQRAEENHRRAREAVDRLLTKVAVDLADEPHMEQIRRALLEDALEFYETFLEQKADDPIIRFETGLAQLRVADIQRMLSRGLESIQNYEEATAIFEALSQEYPRRTEYREQIAHCDLRRGTALARMYRYDDSTAAYTRAISEWQELCDVRPPEPTYIEELARGNYELAHLWYKRYYFDKSGQYVDRANRLLIRLGEEFPNYPVDSDLKLMIPDLLRTTATDRGVVPDAIWKQQTRNYADLPHDPLKLVQYEQECRTVAMHWEQLAETHPAVPDYRKQLHHSMIQLADVLLAMDQFAEVERIYWRMREHIMKLVAECPDIPEYRVGLVWNEFKLGLLLHFTGRQEEALGHLRVGIDSAGELAERYPEEPRHQIHLGSLLIYCPALPLRDPKRAIVVLKRALQLAQNPLDWTTLGFAQMRAGRFKEALASYQMSRQLGSIGPQQDAGEAFVLHFLNKPEEARASYDRAINSLDKTTNRIWYHLECRIVRAELEQLLEIGRTKDSERRETLSNP